MSVLWPGDLIEFRSYFRAAPVLGIVINQYDDKFMNVIWSDGDHTHEFIDSSPEENAITIIQRMEDNV